MSNVAFRDKAEPTLDSSNIDVNACTRTVNNGLPKPDHYAHIEEASVGENQNEQSNILISQLEGILRSMGYIGSLHLSTLPRSAVHWKGSICVLGRGARSLTCQSSSVNEGSMPLGRLDVQKVEEHVKDDFLPRL